MYSINMIHVLVLSLFAVTVLSAPHFVEATCSSASKLKLLGSPTKFQFQHQGLCLGTRMLALNCSFVGNTTWAVWVPSKATKTSTLAATPITNCTDAAGGCYFRLVRPGPAQCLFSSSVQACSDDSEDVFVWTGAALQDFNSEYCVSFVPRLQLKQSIQSTKIVHQH
jgi:hypothetical protein